MLNSYRVNFAVFERASTDNTFKANLYNVSNKNV
jgi:hypothetical protein